MSLQTQNKNSSLKKKIANYGEKNILILGHDWALDTPIGQNKLFKMRQTKRKNAVNPISNLNSLVAHFQAH